MQEQKDANQIATQSPATLEDSFGWHGKVAGSSVVEDICTLQERRSHALAAGQFEVPIRAGRSTFCISFIRRFVQRLDFGSCLMACHNRFLLIVSNKTPSVLSKVDLLEPKNEWVRNNQGAWRVLGHGKQAYKYVKSTAQYSPVYLVP